MFPLSLKKNIRELDRQISLLENECEHLEAEKKELAPEGKKNSRMIITELPNAPFVTDPCASASTYSSKRMVISPEMPKIYSASCGHFRPINEKLTDAKKSENMPNTCGNNNFKLSKKSEKLTELPREETQKETLTSESIRSEKVNTGAGENNETEIEDKIKSGKDREIKKPCKRSISSIREVSESSDENGFFRESTWNLKPKKNSKKAGERQTSELSQKKPLKDVSQKSSKINTLKIEVKKSATEQNKFNSKTSSDEEKTKGAHSDEGENKCNEKWANEYDHPLTPRKKLSNKRRLRSARTKKNIAKEILLDVNMTKVLQEKEIQCKLGNEENEKTEVFTSLCESLGTLYMLISELHSKSSREKINDVLHDMKNTLTRINKLNVVNPEQNSLIVAPLKGTNMRPLEGEQIVSLKKTLFGVTKFCQELEIEKSTMSEELVVKNQALENYKSREKEYLTIISNLKFNLKKMKQEADDAAFVKRDLEILKTKLQEETKVIEALRKSYEKMQELVQNYVLENDKLKAKVKISKLESEKFYVLLAGKEVEINKYKKDLESFQRQITEQLSLLRSKATEKEVEHALKAISHQTNSFRTEMESNPSETTVENENFKTIVLRSMETSSVSSMGVNAESRAKKSLSPEGFKAEESRKKSASSDEDKIVKETATCPTCTVHVLDSESETNSGRRRGLQRVLSSSKNLRSSINELLEDIRRETSEKHWSNTPCESLSQSTLITISSQEISGESEKSKN